MAVIAAVAPTFAKALSHGTLPCEGGLPPVRTRGCRIARWRRDASGRSLPSGMPWMRTGTPDPHARQRRTSLFGSRAGLWRTGRDQKSPLRRCFEPRAPRRAGSASFASDCQSTGSGSRCLPRRQSGLLSGCPPTDTRPQARASLARLQISSRASRFKRFVKRSRRAALKPRGGRARAHVDVTQKRNTATATTQVQRPDGSPSAAAAIEVLSIIRLLCS
jgi:hypothetical protein